MKTGRYMHWTTAALLIAACDCNGEPVIDANEPDSPFAGSTMRTRLCESQSRFFFLDVVVGQPTQGYRDDLRLRLSQIATANRAAWFDCSDASPDRDDCRRAKEKGVQAELVRVLNACSDVFTFDDDNNRVDPLGPEGYCQTEPSLSWRSGQQDRYLRVYFRPRGDARGLLSVNEAQHCAVVQTLRDEAAFAGAQLRAGRAWCATSAMGVDYYLGSVAEGPNPVADWHLRQIGATSLTADPTQIMRGAPSLVLIDSGLPSVPNGAIEPFEDPDINGTNLVSDQHNFFDPISSDNITELPNAHRHASAMWVLMWTLFPSSPARTFSDRVLDPAGSGGLIHLARALDGRLLQVDLRSRWASSINCRTPTPPHGDRAPGDSVCAVLGQRASEAQAMYIFNMSLAWSSELEVPTPLNGPGCSTQSDPMGGAMEFLLDGVTTIDSADTPMLVIAAAGNRPPRATRPSLQDVLGQVPPADRAPAADDARMHYPAEWSRGPKSRLLAVGAIDWRGQPASIAIAGAEPPLVAPGERVYPWPRQNPASLTLQSLADPSKMLHPRNPFEWPQVGPNDNVDAETAARYREPSAFTGTSVAAALVTGAAVRAYSQDMADWLPYRTRQLTGKMLARLLYATATPLGRTNRDGVGVRQLCITALDSVFPLAEDLFTCLDHPSEVFIDPSVEQCLDSLPTAFPQCPTSTPRALPASFQPGTTPPVDATVGSPCTGTGCWQQCSGNCPFDDGTLADRYAASSLGPQPGANGCPTCLVSVHGDQFDLIAQLEASFPPSTTFSDPYIAIESGAETYTIPVDDPPWPWEPGFSFVVSGIAVPVGVDMFDPETTSALVMKIAQPGAETIIDYSKLEVF